MGIGSGGNYALAAARALLDTDSTRRRSCARRWRSPPTSASTPTATSTIESSPSRVSCSAARTDGPPAAASFRIFLRAKSSPSSTASSSARTTPSAPSPSRCATAGGACSSTSELREEVLPKNILMIGPTGVGKTEISRRLARLAGAPFLKVEATKFTEVGYVGRDVEQIVRDLRRGRHRPRRASEQRKEVAGQGPASTPRSACSTRWSAPTPAPATRDTFRKKLRAGELDDKEIEIEVQATAVGMPMFEIPGMPGGADRRDQSSATCSARRSAARTKTRRMTVARSLRAADRRGSRQAARPGRARAARRSSRSRTTASSSSTRSTRSAPATAAAAADVSPRGRAARPAAADRGHDGRDQARRR